MDVKQAVRKAKEYVASLYDDEDITDIGLEEVEFEELSGHWRVTIGFSRPWDRAITVGILQIQDFRRRRSYKVVSINDSDGETTSLQDRI